ncbi:MAG: hypothetical protein AB1813_28610 [Verrucomicrobiota bacterium]
MSVLIQKLEKPVKRFLLISRFGQDHFAPSAGRAAKIQLRRHPIMKAMKLIFLLECFSHSSQTMLVPG